MRETLMKFVVSAQPRNDERSYFCKFKMSVVNSSARARVNIFNNRGEHVYLA